MKSRTMRVWAVVWSEEKELGYLMDSSTEIVVYTKYRDAVCQAKGLRDSYSAVSYRVVPLEIPTPDTAFKGAK